MEADQAFHMKQAVFVRAVEVLGNREKAERWMDTPVRALDYATPNSMLDSSAGCETVPTVLDRLESFVL